MSNKLPKTKETILKIEPYKPGKAKTDNKISDNIKVAKLSSNESALGCSQKAKDIYKQEIENLSRYPVGANLEENIAKVFNIDSSRIVCGAGSDEIISFLCHAFTKEGDEVLYSQYGFLMYPIYAMASGATPVTADEDENELKTNIDNLINKVNDKTKIIFIANPNNPTGTYISKNEIIRLRKTIREDIIIVIDGAYAEYVEEDDYTSGLELVDEYPNIVATRTFSKIHGLAALRIGWCYASSYISDILKRVKGPFNVCTPALKAAIESINDKEFIAKNKAHNDVWLQRLNKELSALGIKTYPSVANFILTEYQSEEEANNYNQHLQNNGIIVRQVANYGLKKHLRITIGTEEENLRVIECFKSFKK